MSSLRILSLPVDDGGCGWYRIRQPLAMMRNHTKCDTHVIDTKKDGGIELARAFQLADIAVYRPGSEEGVEQLRSIPDNKHLKWVIDIDDNVEIISPYSNHYEEYGVEEIKHEGKWLWKDGRARFHLENNRKRLAWHVKGLKEADMVTVTTEKLAEYARGYNDNVAVLPNAIDFSMWWKPDFKPNKQLRVGWSGGSSHYEDWYSIKKPLNKLMREFGFKLIMAGHSFPGVVDPDNRHLIEAHQWVPFKGHSYRMMMMNLDVAIIPLADLPFNHYKSSIKWYEMSAMGVPSLVSNILPYSADIQHGTTAMGYGSTQEFESGLRELLVSPQLRKRIGSNSMEWVRANRDAVQMTKEYERVYKSLLH